MATPMLVIELGSEKYKPKQTEFILVSVFIRLTR